MEMTPKQIRNGISAPSDGHNSAIPGPDFRSVISSAMSSATAKGADGPPVTLTDTVVDWETGVAGHDQSGEA